jgi:hypothetical protein
MVEVDLLDFVETFKRLAKLGEHAGEPARDGAGATRPSSSHSRRSVTGFATN